MSKLVQHVPLSLPNLPAELEGLRLAHLSDLHVRRPRRRHDQIVRELNDASADLLLLTGDYMIGPGDESAAHAAMRRLLEQVTARHGTFGVFGNHDSPAFCRLVDDLPVRWLRNQHVDLPDLPLRVMGLHATSVADPDVVSLLTDMPGNTAQQRMSLMLCHYPSMLPAAGDLGVDLMLSGHTHGGQCRLPMGRALVNSCDLPLHLTSGILRHRDTLCVVSRGLGEVGLPLRVFCRPHLPIYTLTRGPLPGDCCDNLQNTLPW